MLDEYNKNTREAERFSIDLKMLLAVVADEYEIEEKVIPRLGNDRKATQIRALQDILARSFGGVTLKEVTDFCNRAANSMSQAATHFEAQLRESEHLRSQVSNIKAKLTLKTRG